MKPILPKLSIRIKIAIYLFPELTILPEGSFWDKYGIDGYIFKKQKFSVQCKHDTRIYKSGNIWHEIYEKSALNALQPWRKSPGIADLYIFTTENEGLFIGYEITTHKLAELENGRKLMTIYPNEGAATSMGFLLPIHDFGACIELREMPRVNL